MTAWGKALALGFLVLASWASQGAVAQPAVSSCVRTHLHWGDLDGDNQLNREEFIAYTLIAIDGMIKLKENEISFDRAHPNRNFPFLSPEVRRLRLERIQGRAVGEQTFVRADVNGNDHLDGPELVALCGDWVRNNRQEQP